MVGFTAHHVVAASVERREVLDHLPRDDIAGAMTAGFLAWLGQRLHATPGMLDAVLVATQGDQDGAASLRRLEDVDHPRVSRARRYRDDVVVYADDKERGHLILGRGLLGRWEASIEVAAPHRGAGVGRLLAAAAPALAPQGPPVFAQVSPGNVASLRAFMAAGYRPVCSEVLFLRHEGGG